MTLSMATRKFKAFYRQLMGAFLDILAVG